MTTKKVKTAIVIGGGPNGIICANELISQGIETTIFGRGAWGHGLVYGENELKSSRQSFITAKMGVDSRDQQALVNWVKEKGDALDYDQQDLQADSLPPRKLIGEYFEDRIEYVEKLAQENQVKFTKINQSVKSVTVNSNQSNKTFTVSSESHCQQADAIFVCLGNFPSNVSRDLIGSPGYYPEIWGKEIFSGLNLSDQDQVLVLGSGLSSIDVLIGLREENYNGKITFASRTGLLPSTGFSQELDIDLSPALKQIIDSSDPVSSEQLVNAIRDNVISIGGLDPWKKFFMQLGRFETPAQMVVRKLSVHIANIWNRMSLEQQTAFDKYSAYWNAYHIPMSIENSNKVLFELNTHSLEVVQAGVISFDPKTKKFKNSLTPEVNYQAVFNATGRNTDVQSIEDPLIKNLLKENIFQAHPRGGFEVDPMTSESTTTKHAFCVGPLTRGSCFYTYVLSENARQAARAVQSIAVH
jgi:uncharacterized NAD(P)/FAD-binding protein YdhS